jgi:thiol-disulfide isomerase/thioredoxin
MILKKHFQAILVVLFLITVTTVKAEVDNLHAFIPGSYQQILTDTNNQPFKLVVWSITCPSCLKDMSLIKELHQAHPDFKIIMLAADDLAASPQIASILKKSDLTTLENWVYADENTQKLQYEIDPKWYGELPRTYFFDSTHQREGFSGVLSRQDYEARLVKLKN